MWVLLNWECTVISMSANSIIGIDKWCINSLYSAVWVNLNSNADKVELARYYIILMSHKLTESPLTFFSIISLKRHYQFVFFFCQAFCVFITRFGLCNYMYYKIIRLGFSSHPDILAELTHFSCCISSPVHIEPDPIFFPVCHLPKTPVIGIFFFFKRRVVVKNKGDNFATTLFSLQKSNSKWITSASKTVNKRRERRWQDLCAIVDWGSYTCTLGQS